MIQHQLEDSTQVAQDEPAWPYSCNLGASPGAVDDMADQDRMMMQSIEFGNEKWFEELFSLSSVTQ
jgi:hypothetical protein